MVYLAFGFGGLFSCFEFIRFVVCIGSLNMETLFADFGFLVTVVGVIVGVVGCRFSWCEVTSVYMIIGGPLMFCLLLEFVFNVSVVGVRLVLLLYLL